LYRSDTFGFANWRNITALLSVCQVFIGALLYNLIMYADEWQFVLMKDAKDAVNLLSTHSSISELYL